MYSVDIALQNNHHSYGELQALVYGVLPPLKEGAGKRCSECAVMVPESDARSVPESDVRSVPLCAGK